MNNDTSFDIIQESNPVQTVAQPKEDNKMLRATDRITALYCRLSVEDTKEDKKNGKEDLSNSIQNQKAILLQYARDHRFPHPTFFIDDGYSGVDFANRPGFQKMLAEIEAGNVGTVITKDLSRLGRNSSLTGLYINYTFPQNDVRYIAINDHFDSINPNCTDGCPKHIAIPEYFHLYNERFNTQKYQENLESFKKLTQTNGKPSDCIACRACEDKCPQHLKITELLKKVTRQFE